MLPDTINFADFSNGEGYPKPTIIGTTKNENNFWNAWWPFNYRQGASLDTLVAEAVNGTPFYPWNGYLIDYRQGFGDTPETFMANYTFATELIDEVGHYHGAQQIARNLASGKKAPRVYVYRFDWGASADKDYKIPHQDAWKFYIGSPHVIEYDFFWQRFVGHGPGDSSGYAFNDDNLEGRLDLSEASLAYISQFLHDKKGKIKKVKGRTEWKDWTDKHERFMVFDADYQSAHLLMNSEDIYRTPQELYDAYLSHPNPFVRDFVAYYVMWSWHYNWYPNASVDPFDTSPGPNDRFDPLDP